MSTLSALIHILCFTIWYICMGDDAQKYIFKQAYGCGSVFPAFKSQASNKFHFTSLWSMFLFPKAKHILAVFKNVCLKNGTIYISTNNACWQMMDVFVKHIFQQHRKGLQLSKPGDRICCRQPFWTESTITSMHKRRFFYKLVTIHSD